MLIYRQQIVQFLHNVIFLGFILFLTMCIHMSTLISQTSSAVQDKV